MTYCQGSSRTHVILQLIWVWLAKICFSHHQGDISFWSDGYIPCRFVHSHIRLDKKHLQNSIQEYPVWHFYTEICVWEHWWRNYFSFMQSRVYVVSIQTTIKTLLLVHLEGSLLRWPLKALLSLYEPLDTQELCSLPLDCVYVFCMTHNKWIFLAQAELTVWSWERVHSLFSMMFELNVYI